MTNKEKKSIKNVGIFYGTALGIIFGVVFKNVVWGIIIGAGIGGIIDIIYNSNGDKINKSDK
ncbi:hypothetical protein CPAST_c01990 [Clostridium pasteurianum DSM 525 = ATCC 6013]|uniref:Glycine zipper family protein n=1 Tax=Clostridium pasteurianum DSM 525 = ATCC 6013 TaxID=1262449 RepID=A0A0H3IZ42_CLOPA|nr:hypothetical protein [Clostridium pasteurianum]AJA46299.1 hypothetical protein CPAST_c01990 [Clostridium pasteurianum DSM 525 = ATCC 6013]AJA50287.1 hypothetical protein CLPA_c01990 [Clostridium pasteurianum DSM 525 = ATCC 6013]AOZ73750.1 hypothetical protein AQ983_00980 [Clostridium pasteurianum DSM 525 = ATCC 6013]AOZ77547.1 hypothetical protein AQ984_00980 [Clostridium pasteurianum]ELP60883.1 hypothetical protein F502_00440 [Clostridium pasteurianum DSM 525 = ATCC 6013]